MRLGILITVSLLCLWVLAGCRYALGPPVSVADPVTVYLVDYGDTSRVWLPVEDSAAGGEAFVEWGYGDWRWYANDRGSLLYGSVIFLWPTDGTVARRAWDGPPWGGGGAGEPRDEIAGYAEWVYELEVERSAAAELLASLESRYDAARGTEIYNERRRTWFVRDDSSYWLGYQSSSVMAGWLEDLGVDADGFTVRARYRMDEPGRAFDVRGAAAPHRVAGSRGE